MASTAETDAGVVKHIMEFRLDVDTEYQGWILMFSTMSVLWLFCLPCYCAGLSSSSARKFASWLHMHLPAFYFLMAVVNGGIMFLIVTWMPDWTFVEYLKTLAKSAGWTIGHLLKFASSIVMIILFGFLVAFKDRIALMLGLDHKTVFRFKFRDCLNCFSSSRFRAIELTLYKVEDLPAGDVFSANNIYMEVWLGYNEAMKTRVHNNAGSSCILKEAVQLNFDEEDEDDNLVIFVKNQKVVGGGDLARLELTPKDIKECELASLAAARGPFEWKDNYFIKHNLTPRGYLWFRIVPIDEERRNYSPGEIVSDLTTC